MKNQKSIQIELFDNLIEAILASKNYSSFKITLDFYMKSEVAICVNHFLELRLDSDYEISVKYLDEKSLYLLTIQRK